MAAQTVAELPRMHRRYIDEIVPALVAEFRYLNAMQVPSIEKVVINIGLGEAITNARAIDAAIIDLKLITGQAPIVIRAKQVGGGVQAARRDAHRCQSDTARATGCSTFSTSC
jgi:hypothetical protein